MKQYFYLLLIFMTIPLKAQHIVVVGASAAGTTVVKELLKNNFDGQITWITEQTEKPYKKTQIKSVVQGTKKEQDIAIYDVDKIPASVTLLRGKKVIALSSEQKNITLHDGSSIHYDKLFLGIGAKLHLPKEFTGERQGVFPFNTLHDAQNITAYIQKHKVKNAVIVGLGITGMELAHALFSRHINVHALDKNNNIMHHYIPHAASEFLKNNLQGKMTFHTKNRLKDITSVDGHVKAAILDDHTVIPCDLVIFTTGSSVETQWLKNSSIDLKHSAILVNDELQTSLPDVYAGGDCALITDLSTGNLKRSHKWKDAEEQGKVAAQNMLGHQKRYEGSSFMIGSHFFGFNFQSYGPVSNPPTNCETILFQDGENYYDLFLRDQGKLKGYLLLDKNEIDRSFLRKAVEEEIIVPEEELNKLSRSYSDTMFAGSKDLI